MTHTFENPTTSPPQAAPVIDQYKDDFVARWDQLIDWDMRAKGEGRFFTGLAHRAGAKKVLDAATGTGFHAIHFAKAGFEVTALDICPNMIARAEHNAKTMNVPFQGMVADWRDMANAEPDQYDMILCLGSSFPHLLDSEERRAVMKTFARLLVPGGKLVLDQRNFDAIRAGTYANPSKLYYAGTRVKVSPSLENGLCTFEYVFSDGAAFHLSVADLSLDEMQNLFLGAGFSHLQTFGDFSPEFTLNDVGFLIHVATL